MNRVSIVKYYAVNFLANNDYNYCEYIKRLISYLMIIKYTLFKHTWTRHSDKNASPHLINTPTIPRDVLLLSQEEDIEEEWDCVGGFVSGNY